jgi:hypothetical protein
MGVLPTRSWAFSMKLSDSNLCRHCFLHEETFDHFLTECSVLNRDELVRTWPSDYGPLTVDPPLARSIYGVSIYSTSSTQTCKYKPLPLFIRATMLTLLHSENKVRLF